MTVSNATPDGSAIDGIVSLSTIVARLAALIV